MSKKRMKLPEADDYGMVHLRDVVDANELSHTGPNGAWLYLTTKEELKNFTTPALDLGFKFHHASGEYAVMGLWVSKEANSLPKGASHTVGVGVLVADVTERKVLVVKEKMGPAAGRWKFVTGWVDNGEDIADTCAREVFEETGIKVSAKNSELYAVREGHGLIFGLSNLYFCMLLRADDSASKTQTLKMCESELRDVCWMTLDEFANTGQYPVGTLYEEIRELGIGRARQLFEFQQVDGLFNSRCMPVHTTPSKNLQYLWSSNGDQAKIGPRTTTTTRSKRAKTSSSLCSTKL